MCSNSSLFDYGLLAYFPRTYYVTLDIAILPSLLSGQGDRYLGETPESYGNHQNERGYAPHTQFRFVSSFPSYCVISVLVSCCILYSFKRFRFVSVSFLHRLRATETEC